MSSNINGRLRDRQLVIGGHDVVKGRYPYFVSINKNNGVVLNGALIAPDIVLTAGHIALNHMDNITLTVHAWSVSADAAAAHTSISTNGTAAAGAMVVPIRQWILHPQWSQFQPLYFAHDFLIFQLAEPVASWTPLQLNRSPMIPTVGQEVVLMGLGWTNASVQSPSDICQETTLVAVSNEACSNSNNQVVGGNTSYEGLIVPSMMCTKAPPNTIRDGCAWDSGAPVIVPGDNGIDLLVGLGSTGVGCADPYFPGIQARVSADMDWITSQVCALSTDPPSEFQCQKPLQENSSPALDIITLDTSFAKVDEGGGSAVNFDSTNTGLMIMVMVCAAVVFSARQRARRRSSYTPL